MKEDVSEKLEQIKCNRMHQKGEELKYLSIVITENEVVWLILELMQRSSSFAMDAGIIQVMSKMELTWYGFWRCHFDNLNWQSYYKIERLCSTYPLPGSYWNGSIKLTWYFQQHNLNRQSYYKIESLWSIYPLLNSLDTFSNTGQRNLWIGMEIISSPLSYSGNVSTCSAVSVSENCLFPPESESIIKSIVHGHKLVPRLF